MYFVLSFIKWNVRGGNGISRKAAWSAVQAHFKLRQWHLLDGCETAVSHPNATYFFFFFFCQTSSLQFTVWFDLGLWDGVTGSCRKKAKGLGMHDQDGFDQNRSLHKHAPR